MTNIIKNGQAKVIAGVIAILTLLTSCGGPQTPTAAATPAASAPTAVAVANTQQALKAAPTPAAPSLRVVTSPQTLTKDGSVFFFVSSQDQSGQGLSSTEVFVDGERFVNDPSHHNSYGKYFTAKHNGTHKVRVVVTDKSGLSTSVEQDFTVNITN